MAPGHLRPQVSDWFCNRIIRSATVNLDIESEWKMFSTSIAEAVSLRWVVSTTRGGGSLHAEGVVLHGLVMLWDIGGRQYKRWKLAFSKGWLASPLEIGWGVQLYSEFGLRVELAVLHIKKSQLRWFRNLTRTPSGWGVSGLSHQKKSPGQTQNMLETLDLVVKLATPWCSQTSWRKQLGSWWCGILCLCYCPR